MNSTLHIVRRMSQNRFFHSHSGVRGQLNRDVLVERARAGQKSERQKSDGHSVQMSAAPDSTALVLSD
jgi:hypothetical protein